MKFIDYKLRREKKSEKTLIQKRLRRATKQWESIIDLSKKNQSGLSLK